MPAAIENGKAVEKRAASAADAFIPTKEYHRFAEFCEACRRERYIGLCYGPAGVGKTLSARHYTKQDFFENYVPSRYRRWDRSNGATGEIPLEAADCRAAFYTPPVANTPRAVAMGFYEARLVLTQIGGLSETESKDGYEDDSSLDGRCELVLVDEADRLKTPSLEELRDQYDKGDFGLVLIGMPGMEKRLSRYPQLYSRVGFAHAYRPLSAEEVQFILERRAEDLGWAAGSGEFSDAEATAAIARITGGNFRLLDRLLRQSRRIMRVNELSRVTKEVVEAARECLVIGPG